MLEQEKLNWYVRVDGTLKGPFPSKRLAESKMLAEGWSGTIESQTSDGKDILMG